MKKLISLRNILICITFTVVLLLVKDNMNVLWSVLGTIANILTPFAIGFLFAYILNFPYKFFYTKAFGKMGKKHKIFLKLKKPLAIICTYTLLIALFVVLIAIVVPQLFDNISYLIKMMPGYMESLKQNVSDFIAWLNKSFHAGLNADKIINDTINSVASGLKEFISSENFNLENFTQLAGNTFNTVMSAFSGLYNFIMGLVISVYFLAAKETLCYQIKKLTVGFIPIKYLPKIYEIIDITDTKCGRFLVGDIIDAAFVGILTFIIMSIFRLPYAPLIAVFVGITNIIPFFGPFIGAAFGAFILLLDSPWSMLIFIGISFVMQQLDGNIIKPKIIGSQVGLSSFWVLFSVLVGGALFGIIGLILGTPIYAVIYTLVGKRVNNKIKDKGKIAYEALDFEVLNYAKIAAEQKRIREEKESVQKEKIKKLIHIGKNEHEEDESKSEDE